MDNTIVCAVKQTVVLNTLIVTYSDGSVKTFDAIKLGCEWFRMSNDAFYSIYGFNFNPSAHGLYDICRKKVYGNDTM